MLHIFAALLFLFGTILQLSLTSGTYLNAYSSVNLLERTRRQAPNINVHRIPKTSFTCSDKKIGEYYADPETGCQVYHVCAPGVNGRMSPMSFVCPNGTIFNQASRVCTPFDRIDCNLATKFYETLHGNLNSRRTDYEEDNVFFEEDDRDLYEPAPPPPPPPRTNQLPQPRSSSSRFAAPPPPLPPAPPIEVATPAPPPLARAPPRFRTASQFRGNVQQNRPVAVARPTIAPLPPLPPLPPSRPQASAARSLSRAIATSARPTTTTTTTTTTTLAPRVTTRNIVSTSTNSYQYDYEYEYEYEDPAKDDKTQRSKRALYSDYYNPKELDMERSPIPTSFSCQDKVAGGVYADPETKCEMFHICVPIGKRKMLDYRLFCANGTAFSQESNSCEEIGSFDCARSEMFYAYDKLHRYLSGKKPANKKSKYTKPKEMVFS